jgi:hypothetical protein
MAPQHPVECALATRPAAMLISLAWLHKVPYGVVVVAGQQKQGRVHERGVRRPHGD